MQEKLANVEFKCAEEVKTLKDKQIQNEQKNREASDSDQKKFQDQATQLMTELQLARKATKQLLQDQKRDSQEKEDKLQHRI